MKAQQSRSWTPANKSIFFAAIVVGSMTILVKLVALLKEQVVADCFGTSELIDAFVIAFLLPMFVVNVLAGSISAALMPTFIQVRENQSDELANKLFSSVLFMGILFLLIAAIALGILSPIFLPYMGLGFNDQTVETTQSLFYLLLPILIISGIGNIYATALNAGHRFLGVALSPVATSLGIIFALLFWIERWGIYALAMGTLLGAMCSLAIILILAFRRGIPLIPRWYGMTSEMKVVVKQYAPMAAGAFLMSSTILVDQSMAATLDSGSVAVLNYANKVVALFLGVGSMALGTAVLPYFSQMIANRDWKGTRHTFKTYSRLIVFVSIPLTVFLYLYSNTIIGLLFQRGEFSASDTAQVGGVLSLYVLQIPFYLCGILTVRLISSLKETKILFLGACISFPLNIILNYLLMHSMGVSGLALSTSIVYTVSLLFLLVMLKRILSKEKYETRQKDNG